MTVYFYGRNSDLESFDKGSSLISQLEKCKSYSVLKDLTIDVEITEQISGATPFANRPKGFEIMQNIKKNDELVGNIIKFLKKHDIVVDKNFSIIVNRGPGSFSSIRVSLSVAKGIQISKGAKLYGYKDSSLCKFDAKNINLLIEKSLLESKLIKPIYLS